MWACMQAIHGSRKEYMESYLPDLEARKQRVRDAEAKRRAADMDRIERDVQAGRHGTVAPLFGEDTEGAVPARPDSDDGNDAGGA